MKIAVVIPALDEEGSIGTVVRELSRELVRLKHIPKVIIGDNGSTDDTANIARVAGAIVVAKKISGVVVIGFYYYF